MVNLVITYHRTSTDIYGRIEITNHLVWMFVWQVKYIQYYCHKILSKCLDNCLPCIKHLVSTSKFQDAICRYKISEIQYLILFDTLYTLSNNIPNILNFNLMYKFTCLGQFFLFIQATFQLHSQLWRILMVSAVSRNVYGCHFLLLMG